MSAALEVKPLEWAGDEAATPFGLYTVCQTDDGYEAALDGDELAHVGFNATSNAKGSAKEHCEDDYRARAKDVLAALKPSQSALLLTGPIPPDIAESMLKIGKVEWGCTEAQSDEAHLAGYADVLRRTREHFGTTGDTEMHGLYVAGGEIVVAFTGNSPNSPQHARMLTAAWNAMVDWATACRESSPAPPPRDAEGAQNNRAKAAGRQREDSN